jgi:hypothetical protein
VDPGPDDDLLSFEGVINISERGPFPAGLEGGLYEGVVSVLFGEVVHVPDFLGLLHRVKIIMS